MNFKNTILHIIDVVTCAVVYWILSWTLAETHNILTQYIVGTLIHCRNLWELWHQTECESETSISYKRY